MAAAAPPATPPNQTIYINNLNEKVKREELKKALMAMFSQFGPIMDVVAGRSLKVRGQAWIVFGDSKAASSAMRQMQGFPFYDKPMRIQFAKSKSDAVAKLDGTFVKRERPEKPQKTKKAAKKAEAREAADRARGNAGRSPRPGVSSLTGEPANKILFVQNLPDQTNDMMLSMLFQQFPGFREVRLVPGKSGIAFVEFDTEAQATIAMNGLQNFKITPTNHMHVSYAKK